MKVGVLIPGWTTGPCSILRGPVRAMSLGFRVLFICGPLMYEQVLFWLYIHMQNLC